MPTTESYDLCLQNLPSPPSVAIKLLELFDDPTADVDAIGAVIRVDPALASKLVSYCNSPLLGVGKSVDSVNRAIIILGVKSVKMISLSFSLVAMSNDGSNFDYSSFWRRSLALAVSKKALATIDDSDPEKCFLVGLMQNIGEVALYQKSSTPPTTADARSISEIIEAEQVEFNTNRFAVGCDILEAWCFPPTVKAGLCQIAEAMPNDPSVRRADIAAAMTAILTSEQPELDMVVQFKSRFAEAYGEDEAQFEAVFGRALEEWKNYANLSDFDCGADATSLREIEMAAKLKLTEASLAQAQEQLRVEQENRLLKSNAGKDLLTGAKNRQAYEEYAEHCYSRCRRSGLPFTLLVIDIDHFKSCNDTYGHQAGDEALKFVAGRMQQSLRGYDSLYRYGGEEFVVTLPECDQEQAMNVAERLRNNVAAAELEIDGQVIKLTISAGVVTARAPYYLGLAELFERGDKGLYQAKHDGRNRCVAVDVSCALTE